MHAAFESVHPCDDSMNREWQQRDEVKNREKNQRQKQQQQSDHLNCDVNVTDAAVVECDRPQLHIESPAPAEICVLLPLGTVGARHIASTYEWRQKKRKRMQLGLRYYHHEGQGRMKGGKQGQRGRRKRRRKE